MQLAPTSRNAFQNRLLALNSVYPGELPEAGALSRELSCCQLSDHRVALHAMATAYQCNGSNAFPLLHQPVAHGSIAHRAVLLTLGA